MVKVIVGPGSLFGAGVASIQRDGFHQKSNISDGIIVGA